MADEVEEIIEEKPKSSKLKIILGVVGLVVLLIAVVFATLFFAGYFNPKLEIDPEQADLFNGHGDPKAQGNIPSKKTKGTPQQTRL